MKLASILNPNNVILDLQGDTAQDAICHLVEYLISNKQLRADLKEPVIEALYKREEQISTGIGSGVAIPHTFSEGVDEIIAVFGRSHEGVDFDSIDSAPVHFVILLLVPEKDRNKHLQTLAAIAKMFKTCGVREKLETVETREGVVDVLGSCEP
ncbi:MAG: PTS sugar transporter subunit IIA [Akkermansiaceae bacterium]